MSWLRRATEQFSQWFTPSNGDTFTNTPTEGCSRLRVEELESRVVPALVYSGGGVIPNVEVQAVYYGSNWNNDSTTNSRAHSLETYLNYLVQSPYMTMLQRAGYGVSTGSFSSGRVYNVNLASGSSVDDTTIQNTLQGFINNGSLQANDYNRLYVVFVQPNVVVTAGGSSSVSSFAGYHSSFGNVRYAVITTPYGSVNNGSANQNLNTFDEMTDVTSHEVAEAVTDPYPSSGWYDSNWRSDGSQGEIGDIAQDIALQQLGYQYVYLNGYAVQLEVTPNEQLISPTVATVTHSSLLGTAAGYAYYGYIYAYDAYVTGTGSGTALTYAYYAYLYDYAAYVSDAQYGQSATSEYYAYLGAAYGNVAWNASYSDYAYTGGGYALYSFAYSYYGSYYAQYASYGY